MKLNQPISIQGLSCTAELSFQLFFSIYLMALQSRTRAMPVRGLGLALALGETE